jgi:hypothetical protein
LWTVRAYNQEVLGYEYTSEGKRIWFVDGSTDGTGDTGTRAAPFDTVVAAVAAAGPGDTIRIAAGTYNGRCEWTTPGLTLIGDDAETTFIVHDTSYTVKPGPHTTISQLYIYSTDAALGTSIDGTNSKYLTVEDCNLNGPYDGMWADNSFGFVMRRTKCDSTYDGLRLQSAAQFLLEDSVITSDGTHATPGPYRGVFGGTFGGTSPTDVHQGRCINCTFSAVTAQAISTHVAGFEATGNVYFENCKPIGRNTNASSTGGVYGFHEGFGDSGSFYFVGGTSAISNAGSGAKRHINLFGATSIANCIGLQRYMFSGTAGADSARTYDLAPTATVVAAATRTNLATELARVDATISSRNATTPLDAAGTRAALGLSAANLDTQIAAVKADSAAILVDTAYMQPRVPASGTLATTADVGDITIDEAGRAAIAAKVNASRSTFYPVRSRVWKLQRDPDEGIVVADDVVLSKQATEEAKVWIDFAALCGRGEAVESYETPTITGSTFAITADSEELTGNLLGFVVTGGAAGTTGTISFEVTTTADQVLTGTVQIGVPE